MLFLRFHPAAVLGLTPILSANSRTVPHRSMRSPNVSIDVGPISAQRSTKRTLLQARSVLSQSNCGYDKMYGVAGKRVSRRRAYTEQLAGRIETIRVGMGVDPKEMAKRLKLKYETYRSYENGERCMPPFVIVDLIRISGHGAWFVLTGEADSSAPPPAPETGRHRALNV